MRPTRSPLLPTGVGLLLLAWSAGAALVAGRWAIGSLSLRRAYAQGSAPPPQVQAMFERTRVRLGVRYAGLRLSERAASACAFGFVEPRILLPATPVSPATMEAVLAHELCHLRARDPLWLALAALVCAVHWFNPLVWACARRQRQEMELVCDDAAVRLVEPARYAAALVHAARDAAGLVLVAGAGMDRRGLAARVRRLLHRRATAAAPGPKARTAVGLAAGTAVVVVLAVQPLAAAAPNYGSSRQAAAEELRLKARGFNPPRHKANERLVFFDVPADVVVAAPEIGFMCDGIRCVTTVPAAMRVRLTARAAAPVAWSGCTPDPLSRDCWVTPTASPVVVSVRAG